MSRYIYIYIYIYIYPERRIVEILLLVSPKVTFKQNSGTNLNDIDLIVNKWMELVQDEDNRKALMHATCDIELIQS